MRNSITVICTLLFTALCYSQSKYNQFSLEGGIGVSSPLLNADPYNNKGASSKPHLIGTARYMFTELWGIRGSMAYDNFKTMQENGTSIMRFDTQAVLNAGKLFDLPEMTNHRFGILIHGGAGLAFVKSHLPMGKKDKMVSLVGGITPIVRLTDGLSFFVDGSATMDMMRNLYYDGSSGRSNGSIKGAHATLSAGLIISLGRKDHHADWY
jgi:hypothetical protein